MDDEKLHKLKTDHENFVKEFEHAKALRTRRSVVILSSIIQILLSICLLGVTWRASRGVFMWVIE
jgi:hypothetical protein